MELERETLPVVVFWVAGASVEASVRALTASFPVEVLLAEVVLRAAVPALLEALVPEELLLPVVEVLLEVVVSVCLLAVVPLEADLLEELLFT